MSNVDISAVKSYLLGLQQTICDALQKLDGGAQLSLMNGSETLVVVALVVS